MRLLNKKKRSYELKMSGFLKIFIVLVKRLKLKHNIERSFVQNSKGYIKYLYHYAKKSTNISVFFSFVTYVAFFNQTSKSSYITKLKKYAITTLNAH